MVGCAAEYHYKMSDKDIKSASYSSLIITHVSYTMGIKKDTNQLLLFSIDTSLAYIC